MQLRYACCSKRCDVSIDAITSEQDGPTSAAPARNRSPFHARNSLWLSGMCDCLVDQGICPSRTLWCMAMRWPSAPTATVSLAATTSTGLFAYANGTEYQAPPKAT